MAINRTKIKRQLYANGGLGQLVDREKFGIGSSFKKAFKKVTKPVVKVAQKLVPKEIAGPLMMAAPFLGPVYGPIAYAAGSAKKTGRIDPVKLALVAAPYVKFQGGEGIGAFKPVGYGGSKYGVFGGEEVMYDFPTSGTTAPVPSTYTPSGQVPEASEGAISRTYSEPTTVRTVGGGDPGVIVPQVSTPTKPVSLADVAGKYFEEPLKVLKTKEFPEGRSLKDLVVSTATKPETIIGAGVGLAQYIEAKKQELEDQGQEFDREAYENTVNEYYSKFSKSFERGFSNQGGLSQLAPRKKYGGGMSDNRVSQLLLLREEAMTAGDDDKVAELDQELDLILRPNKENGTTPEDIVSMTDEGRSGVIYMTPDGKQIDKETFFEMTDQEENDEEETEEETQSMMTPMMPQPKPSFMQPNAIVAPILEAESQEYIKQKLGKKDGGIIQARKKYANGSFYDNYVSYLNQFQNANLTPTQQQIVTPTPVMSFSDSDSDQETTVTPTPGKGLGSVKISDVLGFMVSPVGFTVNKAIGKALGKTPVQMIQDRISSFADSFGGGNAGEAAGTAADPSTAASEDPGAIGSQSPGGSQSDGGNSAGAAAASAAGSNDGPGGGTFATGGLAKRKQYAGGSKVIEINPYELVGDTGETVVDFYYGGDIDAMVESILPENFQGTYTVVRPANKKDGGRIGYMEGGIKSVPIRTNKAGTKELDYRAKGGFVPIGVKERADDVPAMLSKNEFVFTADAVRGAGNGNINKGARKMYNLMKNLETRKA